jgi:hypothetical protein
MSDSGDEKPGIWLRLLLVTFIPLLMLYLLEPILLENIVFFLARANLESPRFLLSLRSPATSLLVCAMMESVCLTFKCRRFIS